MLVVFFLGVLKAQHLRSVIPTGHSGVIFLANYSHHGKYIQTSSPEDNSVKIWETKTGKLVYTLHENNSTIVYSSFSFDDHYLVTFSLMDTTIKVWDISSEMIMHEIPVIKNNEFFPSVEFVISPTENVICTWGDDSTVKVWDLVTGSLRGILKGHADHISSLKFSNDGKLIFSASIDGTVKIWDSHTSNLIKTVVLLPSSTKGNEPIGVMAFDQNGDLMLVASKDYISVWDLQKNQKLKTLEGLSADQDGLTAYFSNDSRFIISRTERVTKVWSTATGLLLHSFTDHTGFAVEKNFTSNGKYIATATKPLKGNTSVNIWELTSGKKVFSILAHRDSIMSIAFSPDNSKLITASVDQTAKVWDLPTGELVYTLQGFGTKTTAAIISLEGSYFVVGDQKGRVSVCELTGGKRKYLLNGQNGSIHSVDISKDESLILTGASDNTTRVWDYRTGVCLYTLYCEDDSVLASYFSPQANYVLTMNNDKSATVWDARSGKSKYLFEDKINTAFFSSDDKYIVTTNREKYTMTLVLAESGKILYKKELKYKRYDKQWLNSAMISPGEWDPLESTCRHASLSIL